MEKIEEFRKRIQALSEEEKNKINKLELEEYEKQYSEFKENFIKERCYVCNKELNYFDINSVCIHWLLRRNKRFKPKNFKLIYKKFGYFQISSYLKWVANLDKKLQNINNLEEEKNPKKVFEYTIKFKEIEWSFSCGLNDYKGHEGTQVNFPHYHFQMRVNNQTFIDYGRFHPKFSDEDLFNMQIKLGNIPEISYVEGEGSGMQELFDKLSPEELMKNLKYTEDGKKADIRTSYFIEAKEGHKIKGEDLQKILQLRKKEGKPLWNYKDQLKNCSIKAIVNAGENTPEIAGREGGRGTKNKKSKEDKQS
jgi:hypothetical protein